MYEYVVFGFCPEDMETGVLIYQIPAGTVLDEYDTEAHAESVSNHPPVYVPLSEFGSHTPETAWEFFPKEWR